VSISSSTTMARLPLTSPMTFQELGPVEVALASLLDDRQRGVELLGEEAGPLGVYHRALMTGPVSRQLASPSKPIHQTG
jgi:hypothetical protein